MNGTTGAAELYSESPDGGPGEADVEYVRRRRLILGFSTITLVAVLFIVPCFGPIHIPWTKVVASIVTLDASSYEGRIVWNIRMVRLVGAVIAGAGLSVCGTVMQCILRNPLASPYTLGLSNAAAFGAAFSIVFAGAGSMASSSISINNPFITTISAFVFSMLATGLIALLTRITRISAETMVLAGIAISAIFSALLSFTQYVATDSQLGNIVSWMFGDVGKANWTWDLAILAILIPITVYFLLKRWDYNAMDAGEDTARSLGVNTSRERMVGMVLSSLLCSVIVSFFGIIAFIGLLGPHIARMVLGGDHRYLIPGSMIIGAVILVVSDQIGMYVIQPEVLPVGIITSMVGGPLFIYLLARRYRA
ncbi:MAG: iron ABC transporter permease [Candidatus Methanomethylophilaceae archaeon]|nr:iron ABC transporter permease [Candidatus Methanomethylophilaceae archaeon]